jgi:hypothetical protein
MPSGDGPVRVNLSPPHRSRAALRVEHEKLAEDLLVLLRRAFKPAFPTCGGLQLTFCADFAKTIRDMAAAWRVRDGGRDG